VAFRSSRQTFPPDKETTADDRFAGNQNVRVPGWLPRVSLQRAVVVQRIRPQLADSRAGLAAVVVVVFNRESAAGRCREQPAGD